MLAAAIASGTLIGAALGLLGAGGSTLTVPIFVYLLGFPAKEAIAMSLAVVGVTSAASAAVHGRAGNVNVRVAAIFAAVAAFGTLGGAHLARFISGGTQLMIFGAVMLGAAVFMLRGGPTRPAGEAVSPGDTVAAFGRLVPAALAVGLLTGIAGVGGGFLIVPALLLLRLSMGQAVGTSLLIIAANCIVGVYGYMGRWRSRGHRSRWSPPAPPLAWPSGPICTASCRRRRCGEASACCSS